MARPRRLIDSIREQIELPPGAAVVALSGGADSSLLAWLAGTSTQPARAVFVDHGLSSSADLRGAAAEVAEVCGIQLDIVEARVDRETPSFEDAARRARYRALVAAAKPDEWIFTGHTADDQAETVLGNFLRGAGMSGLAGIPVQRGQIIRPLLGINRHTVREAAIQLGLPFFDDPDNESPALRRNRLRSQLIPQLESEYNPALREALGRTARIMAADEAALEKLAERIPVLADGESVGLPASALVVSAPAVASRAVRAALRAARGPHGGAYDEVLAILAVARGDQRAVEVAGGLRIEREGPLVVVSGSPPMPVEPVELSNEAEVRFDRWVVRLTGTDARPRPAPIGSRVLFVDAGAVGPDLMIRPCAGTDRIAIQDGSKSVTTAMAERGVARRFRRRWPVVTSEARVAVIPGVRVAHWARPRQATARYLRVSIESEERWRRWEPSS